MPNPSPKTEHLRSVRPDSDVAPKLSRRTTGACLEPEIEAVVDKLPNKSAWLRRVIREAAEREGLL